MDAVLDWVYLVLVGVVDAGDEIEVEDLDKEPSVWDGRTSEDDSTFLAVRKDRLA